MTKLVLVSDTHLRRGFSVPDGDVLIHCGDATLRGTANEIREFADWLGPLPHKHKVFVPGNHDWLFETKLKKAMALLPKGTIVLIDSGAEIEGLKFWGSPWQPWFLNWAFNETRGSKLKAHWDKIPSGLDVLVTHSPPYGILDTVPSGENVGCEDLRDAVARAKPRLHCFGHIHGAYGQFHSGITRFVNCSVCDERYEAIHPVMEFDL